MILAKPEFWACVSPDYDESLALLSRLRVMAASVGACVAAVAFPQDAHKPEVFQAGAEKVYCIKEAEDERSLAVQLVALCRELRPQIVLFPATVVMRAAAALAAAMLDCGLCADCTGILLREDGVLIQRRPAFGESLVADIVSENSRPQMATVRPGVYAPVFVPASSGEIIPSKEFAESETKLIHILAETGLDQNPLSDARLIVAGGKGIGPRGFEKLHKLARLTGASVGASRGAVNTGYAPYLQQVGLTGVTVRPEVYFAFGISGAVQHIAGMSNSGYVAAVNTDKNAPIFEYADTAIVSPWEKVVDALLLRFGENVSPLAGGFRGRSPRPRKG
ncbi:MAG: electron transfer flavoprotein subunit alpha/FixB family protein [Spirochaetales bacterium]|jgi:electron transfer flavoprotein alpha subunit|nr:electron transfer flavoprotein subunit alpha/FixB family protein [Spirochaetales bacterium]